MAVLPPMTAFCGDTRDDLAATFGQAHQGLAGIAFVAFAFGKTPFDQAIHSLGRRRIRDAQTFRDRTHQQSGTAFNLAREQPQGPQLRGGHILILEHAFKWATHVNDFDHGGQLR